MTHITIFFELFASPVALEPHAIVLTSISHSSCMDGSGLLVTAKS